MSNYPGYFITFEGGEGCGKSIQIKLLANKLEELGLDIVVTKEFGSPHSPECVEIGGVLHNSDLSLVSMAELFLVLADRVQHVSSLVKPSLKAGKIVLSDRYSDSTFAYQHFGRGLDFFLVNNLNLKATESIEPDLTFLLDIEPGIGFRRIKGARDRIEQAGPDFHKLVNEGFRQIAKKFPERIVVIDATKSKKEIQSEIFSVVKERLDKAGIQRKIDTTGEAAIKGGNEIETRKTL